MNNERRKLLKEIFKELQQFVDGNVPEADALDALSGPIEQLSDILFDEQESRDNLLNVTPSGTRADKAIQSVYAIEDINDDLTAAKKHLQDMDADYKGLIDVYIKSAMDNIKKAIGK